MEFNLLVLLHPTPLPKYLSLYYPGPMGSVLSGKRGFVNLHISMLCEGNGDCVTPVVRQLHFCWLLLSSLPSVAVRVPSHCKKFLASFCCGSIFRCVHWMRRLFRSDNARSTRDKALSGEGETNCRSYCRTTLSFCGFWTGPGWSSSCLLSVVWMSSDILALSSLSSPLAKCSRASTCPFTFFKETSNSCRGQQFKSSEPSSCFLLFRSAVSRRKSCRFGSLL